MPDRRVVPIGVVVSPLSDPALAPRQGDEGAPEAWLEIDGDLEPALEGVRAGEEVLVLTWLHLAHRDRLRVVPRGEVSRPELGVFATRAAHRPNPIGLHRVTVVETRRERLRVLGLEAVDGTPVIDIKPVLGALEDR